MKFLVTGGAGFIGTNLTHHLAAAGHDVTVLDDLSAGDATRLPGAARFVEGSVRDVEKLARICEGAEVVVHLAALPRVQFSIDFPIEAHEVNVTGTLNVLEAARAAGVRRLVYAASSAAYGDQEVLPLSEDLPAEPKSPYALQKYMGEQMLRLWHELYGLETVSLRFFNVYGPHLDPDGPYALVIGRFLKLACEGRPLTITGDGEQTRDFVHVEDVVRAIELASVSDAVGRGEVLNVGAGSQTTINEIARMIGGEIEYVPPRIEPRHTRADLGRIRAALGWEPRIGLAEGIAGLKRTLGIA